MTAEGIIYYVLHMGKEFYYLPTQETWTLDLKRISLGDIYFSNLAVRYFMGKTPAKPDMKDYPTLSPVPDKKKIKITIL